MRKRDRYRELGERECERKRENWRERGRERGRKRGLDDVFMKFMNRKKGIGIR